MAVVTGFFYFLSSTVTPNHKNCTAVTQIIKRTEQSKVSMQTAWLSVKSFD